MAVPPRSPEIDKYIATLAKDPKSKVFAALAEAYRKAGALDEAIHVCQEGLKYNPNYLSGIVALGRSYFEKGMKAEAREQFERVVKSSPDNVVAQRILGGIYAEEGRKEAAIKSFKLILALNPKDAEALDHLDVLEGRKPPPAALTGKPDAGAPPGPESSAPQQEKPGEPPPGPPAQGSELPPLPGAGLPPQGEGGAQRTSSGASSVSPPAADLVGAKDGGTPPVGVVPPGQSVGQGVGDKSGPSPAQESSSGGFEDFDEAFKDLDLGTAPPRTAASPAPTIIEPEPSAPPAIVSQEPPLRETPTSIDRTEEGESGSAGTGVQIDIEGVLGGSTTTPPGPDDTGVAARSTPETQPQEGVILDELFTAPKPDAGRPQPAAAPSSPTAEAPKASLSTSTLADLYFKQGYLDKALAIYQSMLEEQPGNAELTARVAAVRDAITRKEGDSRDEISPPPPARAQAASPSARAGAFAGAEAIDISAEENIQRLSVWLEKIKRGG